MAESKPWWESASTSIAAILVPIAVAFVGSIYSGVVKNREVESQFVALAVDILQQEPTEDAQPLRSWAVSILDEYSGVSMSQEVKDNLIQRESLPRVEGVVNANGNPLNIRSVPSFSGSIIGGLDPNARIEWSPGSETVADGVTWVQLSNGGWVVKEYIRELKPQQ